MPIAEQKALEILNELIRKPESKAEDIPRIWGELLTTYNATFAPPAEEPKKKRRKRRAAGSLSPNLGWPSGVSRSEYSMWKESQQAKGITENINPQEYKRLKDAGKVSIEAGKSTNATKDEKPGKVAEATSKRKKGK